MTTTTTHNNVELISWKRAKNTHVGNPVFTFVLKTEDGKVVEGKTRPNAGFVYKLASHLETLSMAVIAVTPSGRVYMDNADH